MRQGIVVLTAITLAGGMTACHKTKTDEEKTIYAIGVSISRNLAQFNLTPAELELVKAGIADGLANKQSANAELDTFAPKITELLHARLAQVREAEKKRADAFLEKAAAEAGAQKQPSGLIYTEIQAGDGKQPKPTDKVTVNYTGTLADGTVFDSSIPRGEPAEFAVNGVIPCWTEGLQLMKEHGKAKLVCPSELAYGDRGLPPKIKPGAALVFEVDLLDVSVGDTGGQAAPTAAGATPGATAGEAQQKPPE